MSFKLLRFFYERRYRYFERRIDKRLVRALDTHDYERARALLAIGADPNTRGKDGMPLIFYYTGEEQAEQFDFLISKGALLGAVSDTGKTLLMAAAEGGCIGTVRSVLAAGLALDAQDKDGKTALMYALSMDAEDVVWELCKAGADIMCTDNDGNIAVQLAALWDCEECWEALSEEHLRWVSCEGAA